MVGPGPSPQDLVDLDMMKGFYNPGLGDDQDGLLQTTITAVSDWISKYLSRNLYAQQYVEVRNGNGMPTIWLWNSPVIQVQQVLFSPAYGTGGDYPINQFTWDTHQVILTGVNLGGYSRTRFPNGPKNITITYTAGYNTPGMKALARCAGYVPITGARDLPADLQLACLEQMILVYKGASRIGDTGLGVGGERLNYFMGDMTPRAKSILQLHREVTPTGIE